MILSDPVQIEKQEQEALGLARHLGVVMATLPAESLAVVSPIVADEMVKAFSYTRTNTPRLN